MRAVGDAMRAFRTQSVSCTFVPKLSLFIVIVFFGPRTNRSQFFPLGPIGPKKFGGITNFAPVIVSLKFMVYRGRIRMVCQ
jgi:hypothetical protein